MFFSVSLLFSWLSPRSPLWESQQEFLDLQVPLALPLRLAGKVGEAVPDLLQDLVQVAVEVGDVRGELGLVGQGSLQGGSNVGGVDGAIISRDKGLELVGQLDNNPSLDHGHEVTDGGGVAADVVHEVAVLHDPPDTLWGLLHTLGVVAVALELWLVLEDSVEDGLEDGLVPGFLSLYDRVGDNLDGGGLFCHGEGVLGQAEEERVLDVAVEEGEVLVGDDLVLVSKGTGDVDLALALAGHDRGGKDGH